MNDWLEYSYFGSSLGVEGFDEQISWFYHPEYSKSRKQLEVRCIDSTHLLTRTRRKSYHGGIEGMTNDPWLQVAKQGSTFLTPVMVTDITDPMSMSMAVTHFSKEVQNDMRHLGFVKAASLCHDIYDWWTAEDEPGIPALERIKMMMSLRTRLLGYVDFTKFPSPGMHIEGWPAVLWEALIANIDAKCILYSLCKSGTYNQRAFSSMMGETFFSELTHHDRSSHGTVSAEEFGRYMSKCVQQTHVRLDPKRYCRNHDCGFHICTLVTLHMTFHYHTSKSRSYRPVEQFSSTSTDDGVRDNWVTPSDKIHSIVPRDHFFDTKERRRLKGKKRVGTISKDRNSLQKGTLGVRWETARRNEGKMLLTKKIGIE